MDGTEINKALSSVTSPLVTSRRMGSGTVTAAALPGDAFANARKVSHTIDSPEVHANLLRHLRELLRGCRRTTELVNAYVRDANRQGLSLSPIDDSIEKSIYFTQLGVTSGSRKTCTTYQPANIGMNRRG